jgi:hypothetical protein
VFHERYSDEQREAIAAAYVDRRIRPARRVVELAAAGELMWNGQPLGPFETNASTVRSLASAHARRRAGLARSELAVAPPQDAVEALRRRLVNAADAGVTAIERKQKRSRGEVSFEELRQAARAVREISALPGPNDPRPPAPGARVNGRRDGGATRGGLAGQLLAAVRESPPAGAAAVPHPRLPTTPDDPPAMAQDDPVVADQEWIAARLRELAGRSGQQDTAMDDGEDSRDFDDDPAPDRR